MARAEYYVVHHENQWKINHEGKHHGPYGNGTQQEAIDIAVATAKKAFAAGHPAQVHIQGRDGKFRTEFTYGNDPKRFPG